MAKSIIKESEVIRNCIRNRINELDETLSKVCNNANSLGMKISIASLSKYLKKSKANNLTEEQIVWLCVRYCIPVTFIVGNARFEDGKMKFKLPPYNEDIAMKDLKIKFPANEKKMADKPRVQKNTVKVG